MDKNNIENIDTAEYDIVSIPETTDMVDYDKNELKRQEILRYAEDTEHRRKLILWVKFVVSLWLLCVIIVVAFNSIFCFKLNDSVLIALLTTTTVNILGLAFIVLRGLFDDNIKYKKPKITTKGVET